MMSAAPKETKKIIADSGFRRAAGMQNIAAIKYRPITALTIFIGISFKG
jgi:hypothetical protein